jgi:hypothetical protein
MRFFVLFIVSVICSILGYAQDWEEDADYLTAQDTIIVGLQRLETGDRANDHFLVHIKNFKSDPICIVHSGHGFLFEGVPPLRLALRGQEGGFDMFNLGWVQEDLDKDDHYSMDYLNGEPVLPHQTITFEIVVPEYLVARRIIFEYMVLPDFCYSTLHWEIYHNGEWSKEKERKKIVVDAGHRSMVEPPHTRRMNVDLIDSLGGVSFNVPESCDTSLVWINRSDRGRPYEEQDYRFQPKHLGIRKEPGLFYCCWPKDSVVQLIIRNTRDSTIRSAKLDNKFQDGDWPRLEATVTSDSRYRNVVFHSIERVAGGYFNIVGVEKADSSQDMKVIAETYRFGLRITFEYHLMTAIRGSVSRNFISNSLELIRTICFGEY